MATTPIVPEHIQKRRYGQWAGNPNGTAYDPNRCAVGVWPARGRGMVQTQCSRKHVDGGLYCKQHGVAQ